MREDTGQGRYGQPEKPSLSSSQKLQTNGNVSIIGKEEKTEVEAYIPGFSQ